MKRGTRKRNSNSGGFALEVRIRGKAGALHQETCQGLEDAVRIGEKWFRAFHKRNSWFVQDSVRKRIFILLDSETKPHAFVNKFTRK